MKNTIEGNKLIGMFMGGYTKETAHPFVQMWFADDEIGFDENNYPENTHDGNCYKFNELKYHSDWNWLMLVVEKIQKLRSFCDNINLEYGLSLINAVDGWLYREHKTLTKKEAVYCAVVDFIQWYNENSLKKDKNNH